jgi:hypothetical protein
MNWDFFDIVQAGMEKGYKSKWAVYQAVHKKIPITIDDLKELGEFYNHKSLWAYHTAMEFKIPIKRKKIGMKKNEQPGTAFL